MNGSDGFLSIAEEQQAELEVMKELHKYCSKHGLRYVLGYGTLLGAVRHNGFIPWDNDMDVLMPREDMDKLVELVQKDPISPFVKIMDMTTNENYHYPIVRACNMKTIVVNRELRDHIENMGLWVDIFPLDGISKAKQIIQKPLTLFYIKMLNATMYISDTESKSKTRFRKIIVKLFPDRNHKYERHLSSLVSWCKYDQAETVCVLCEEGTDARQAMDREDVENPTLIQFEDAEFYIPRNYDKYLKKQYGDYMKLPPEEARMTHLLNSKYIE